MTFKGRVVIVTGASSGIGAAAAKAFAQRCSLLTIIGRNEQRLMTTASNCESVSGKRPLCLLLDLTQPDSCEEVVRKTIETYKQIDILVNCAGKVLLSSLFDSTMEVFDELVCLNLRVPYKMVQLCIPHLVKTRGNIVNVFAASSRSRPGLTPFGMIRNGLETFTKTGAAELASEGVRMNAVRPGYTRTNFLRNLNIDEEMLEQAYDYLTKEVPSKKIIEPEEIAKTILFVASNETPNLTGACLEVDGANSAY